MLGLQQEFKYDGPLRPFVRRDERDPAMREGCDPGQSFYQHQKGAKASPHSLDAFPNGHDTTHMEAALSKPYSAQEMYHNANTGGVMLHSFAPYHPLGGRHVPSDMYAPRVAHHEPRRATELGMERGINNVRYTAGIPDMTMMRPGGHYEPVTSPGVAIVGINGYGIGTAPHGAPEAADAGRLRTRVKSKYDDSRYLLDEVMPRKPPMDEASLQKRKRNRIAQKKYRERKKTETSRVQGELEIQKEQLTQMETINMNVVDAHARNAVLTELEENKNREIAALKKMLGDLQDIDVPTKTATGSNDPSDTADSLEEPTPPAMASLEQRMIEPELEDEPEKGIVMDIVGAKFVEDMFPDVVRDIKTEVHGHIKCERRLPLLLNYMQERLLRSPDSPHYSAVLGKVAVSHGI